MLQCRPLNLLVTGSVTAIACHMKLRDSARTSLGQGERDKHCTPDIFPKPTVSVSYDVAIIGGGVIDLAVAHKLAKSNQSLRIVVIEKEDSVAAGASSGNSGLGCTGYDAPVGSLERELLRRSIRLHPQFYRSLGLHAGEGGHVRKSGSLVVAWNDEQAKRLPHILEENRQAGDNEACLLSKEELRELAPELSHEALGAVLCPYEAVVEPWLVPVGFAIRARELGVDIFTSQKVVALTRNVDAMNDGEGDCRSAQLEKKSWSVSTVASKGVDALSIGRSQKGSLLVNHNPYNVDLKETDTMSSSMTIIEADVVINCAGLYGDEVEQMKHCGLGTHYGSCDPKSIIPVSPFVVTPRKGQFVVFRPKANLPHDIKNVSWRAPNMIIEPVPTIRTKGVILWQTVYGTVVVGPTATDQKSKDDRSTDMATLQELIAHGKRVMPGLEHWEVIGSYSGLRPSTEHRDYQIYTRPELQWVCVGGIRSTGLTAATGIAEHVVQRIFKEGLLATPNVELDYTDTTKDLGISEAAASTLPLPAGRAQSNNFRYDSLEDISRKYEESSNLNNEGMGSVCLRFNGFNYRVTHPISSFGMENYGYIRAIHRARSDDCDI